MLLIALSLVAAADQGPATAPAKPLDPGSQIICRRLARTGSRLSTKRVCLPAFEWRLTEERAQRDVGDIKRRSQMEQLPAF